MLLCVETDTFAAATFHSRVLEPIRAWSQSGIIKKGEETHINHVAQGRCCKSEGLKSQMPNKVKPRPGERTERTEGTLQDSLQPTPQSWGIWANLARRSYECDGDARHRTLATKLLLGRRQRRRCGRARRRGGGVDRGRKRDVALATCRLRGRLVAEKSGDRTLRRLRQALQH